LMDLAENNCFSCNYAFSAVLSTTGVVKFLRKISDCETF
jgi:hypothetical protein